MGFGSKSLKIQQGGNPPRGAFLLVISRRRHEIHFEGMSNPTHTGGCPLGKDMITNRFTEDGLQPELRSPDLFSMDRQSAEDSRPPAIVGVHQTGPGFIDLFIGGRAKDGIMADNIPLGCAGHTGNSPACPILFDQKLRVDKRFYGIPLSIDRLEKTDYSLGVLGTEKVKDITLSRFDIISHWF